MNLYTKSEVSILKVVEISLPKNLERKKKKTNIGKNKQENLRPIFNPTIQFVVVNLYTRFEVSILNSCGDIFDEKSGKKEKGTN